MTRNDIPDYYQAKFWVKGHPEKVFFGKVEKYHSEALEEWEKGNLLISDAITGELMSVPFEEIEIENQPMEWGELDPETRMPISTEYDRHIFEAYKEADRLDEEAGEGLKKNRMFRINVADGFAFYVVTKVNKKTCKVEWRNFGADNYTDQILGWGGTFQRDIIERQVKMADGMKKLFSACSKAKETEVA